MPSMSKNILTFVALCGAVATAHADVILSSAHRDPRWGIDFSSSVWESFSFTTGSQAYALDSVSMHLSSVVPGSVQVSLYSQMLRSYYCGWGPGGMCTTSAPGLSLSVAGLQTVQGEGAYTFKFAQRPVLQADTIYWIVFQGLGDAALKYYEFGYESLPNWKDLWESETGAEVYQFARSPSHIPPCSTCDPYELGVDWMVHSGINVFQVDGTRVAEVPEPGSLPLVALGLAGALAFTSRRARGGRGGSG